jgi:hypothetical protein
MRMPTTTDMIKPEIKVINCQNLCCHRVDGGRERDSNNRTTLGLKGMINKLINAPAIVLMIIEVRSATMARMILFFRDLGGFLLTMLIATAL